MAPPARRIQHCPTCDRKHDTTRLAPGRGFPCDKCSAVLIVPATDDAKNLELADPEQAARVRRRSRSAVPPRGIDGPKVIELRPRIQVCPGCGRRHDTTRLLGGRGFPCDRCSLVLVVPSDPDAAQLERADEEQAERVRRRLRLHVQANALRAACAQAPPPATDVSSGASLLGATARATPEPDSSVDDAAEALTQPPPPRTRYGPGASLEPLRAREGPSSYAGQVRADAALSPEMPGAVGDTDLPEDARIAPDDSFAVGAVLAKPETGVDAHPEPAGPDALDDSYAVGALLVEAAHDATRSAADSADSSNDDVGLADAGFEVSPLDDDASFVEDAVPIDVQDPGELEDSAAIEGLSGQLQMLDLDTPPPPPPVELEAIDVETARRSFTEFHAKAKIDAPPPSVTPVTRRRTRGGALRTAHAPLGEADTTRLQVGLAIGILVAMGTVGVAGAYVFTSARQDKAQHDKQVAQERNPPPEPPPTVTPQMKAKVVSAETIPPGRSIEITGVVVAHGSFPDRRSALVINARGHGVFWVEDVANRARGRFDDLAEQCAGPKPVCVTLLGTTRAIAQLPATHSIPPTVRAVGVWIEVEPETIREVDYVTYLETKKTLEIVD